MLSFSLLLLFDIPPPTPLYTPSLHDALPIFARQVVERDAERSLEAALDAARHGRLENLADGLIAPLLPDVGQQRVRSEEHTSELQSRQYLVCRLLLEKKRL